ncbi:hypothetical protein AK812_SmicGene14883 [Symbiodinium microadriaticum]|uniref:Uncharacterized protein n=1 Tax=Symbiodinium microadriaticum TaxID=2951 RepID=A0A1Q9E4C2_SYMMI|nr:hypothetical protein AK812_SmicGene14883 [Symbiodinium microadriaticum]CAE7946765.1 unnamed protein product [Symbiodinium sp. KB8]
MRLTKLELSLQRNRKLGATSGRALCQDLRWMPKLRSLELSLASTGLGFQAALCWRQRSESSRRAWGRGVLCQKGFFELLPEFKLDIMFNRIPPEALEELRRQLQHIPLRKALGFWKPGPSSKRNPGGPWMSLPFSRPGAFRFSRQFVVTGRW